MHPVGEARLKPAGRMEVMLEGRAPPTEVGGKSQSAEADHADWLVASLAAGQPAFGGTTCPTVLFAEDGGAPLPDGRGSESVSPFAACGAARETGESSWDWYDTFVVSNRCRKIILTRMALPLVVGDDGRRG